jgi:hypothetical protein
MGRRWRVPKGRWNNTTQRRMGRDLSIASINISLPVTMSSFPSSAFSSTLIRGLSVSYNNAPTAFWDFCSGRIPQFLFLGQGVRLFQFYEQPILFRGESFPASSSWPGERKRTPRASFHRQDWSAEDADPLRPAGRVVSNTARSNGLNIKVSSDSSDASSSLGLCAFFA